MVHLEREDKRQLLREGGLIAVGRETVERDVVARGNHGRDVTCFGALIERAAIDGTEQLPLEIGMTPVEGAELSVSLRGRLDATTLPSAWARAASVATRASPCRRATPAPSRCSGRSRP